MQQLAATSCNLIEWYEEGGKKVVQLVQWQERIREGVKEKWPAKTALSKPLAGFCSKLLPSSPSSSSPPSPTPTPTPLPVAATCMTTQSPPATAEQGQNGKRVRVDLEKLIPDKSARTTGDGAPVIELMALLNGLYHRPETDPWSYEEQHQASAIVKQRPNWKAEWGELHEYRRSLREKRWFPQSIASLLNNWTVTLDKARGAKRNPSMRG